MSPSHTCRTAILFAGTAVLFAVMQFFIVSLMQFFIVSLIAQHSMPPRPAPLSLYYGADCCMPLPLYSDRLSLLRPTTPSHGRPSSLHSTTPCHMPYNGNAPVPPCHRCRYYAVDCCMSPVTDRSPYSPPRHSSKLDVDVEAARKLFMIPRCSMQCRCRRQNWL